MDLVLDAEGNLQGGPIGEIVGYLSSWSYPSAGKFKRHARALLFAFRSACEVQELLGFLEEIGGDLEEQDDFSKEFQAGGVRARLQFILSEWVRVGLRFDFAGEEDRCARLARVCRAAFPAGHEIFGVLEASEQADAPLPGVCERPASSDSLDRGVFVQVALRILNHSAHQIACALSEFHAEMYRDIRVSELMNKNWQRSEADSVAPHLTLLRKHFNMVSFWVASCITLAYTKESQIAMYQKLVAVASELHDMRNWQAMGETVSGLTSQSVERLKYLVGSLKRAEHERLEEMEALLHHRSNYKKYREALSQVPEGEPCIPFLPIHLRDLLVIHEREPDWLEDTGGERLANFTKMVDLGDAMYSLLRFQSCEWPHVPGEEDEDLCADLLQLQFLDDDAIYEWSSKWKDNDSDSTPSLSFNLVRFKAPVYAGHVLLRISFNDVIVSMPFPMTGRWEDLRARCASLCGSYKVRITCVESDVAINDEASTMGFFAAHSDLLLKISADLTPTSRPRTSLSARRRRGSSSGGPTHSPRSQRMPTWGRERGRRASLSPTMALSDPGKLSAAAREELAFVRRKGSTDGTSRSESTTDDSPRSPHSPQLSARGRRVEDEFDPLDEIAILLRDNMDVRDRRRGLRRYAACFPATDAVSWLANYYNTSRERATEICVDLFDHFYLRHVQNEVAFKDDKHLFSFTSEEERTAPARRKKAKRIPLVALNLLFALSHKLIKLHVLSTITLQEFRVMLELMGVNRAYLYESVEIEIVEPYHFRLALQKDNPTFIVQPSVEQAELPQEDEDEDEEPSSEEEETIVFRDVE